MAESPLVWNFNPWRDRRGWRHPVVALPLLLALSGLAGYAMEPYALPRALAWGGLSLLALSGMTANLFLPVSYRLDGQGVTVRFLGVPSFRAWSHYRNFYVHDTLVHLTTMPKPSALDPFRGHALLLNGNREAVAAMLGAHIERPVPKVAAS